MSRLNVLVLHRMGDPKFRREAVRALEYMIPENRPDLNCIVHDAELPFPDYLKTIEFHLIVLGPTFLCFRYDDISFKRALKSYAFVGESQACKVALPQDDYDCSGILDDWMEKWAVDRVYTVCPKHWDVLYPRSIETREIKLGYTGYISEAWINAWGRPKEFKHREIDVSYRASKLPANFGSLGQLKWEIAGRFVEALGEKPNLNLDISINREDMIPGDKWHDFIESSKYCLTTASGSSLLDPRNEIRKCVKLFTSNHPNAQFCEIEQNCFPGLDKRYLFTAISPRNIEAALAETVQLATSGSYSELMEPVIHYIPLKEDCSNIYEVLAMMKDDSFISDMRRKCKESMLSESRLRTKVIVNEIIEFSESVVSRRNLTTVSQKRVDTLLRKYYAEIGVASDRFWARRRIEQKCKLFAAKFGGRRFKKIFSALR